MEAMRLGTLPIVAPTGGLKDTVEAGGKGGYIGELSDINGGVTHDLNEQNLRLIKQTGFLDFYNETKLVV
jgi:glycogen synthase